MNRQSVAFVVLLLIGAMQCGMGQTTYQLPFASSGNTIELSVANTATIPLAGITVEATNVPSWLKFTVTEQRIALLKAQQEMATTFTFTVDKTAPVQKSQTLKFVISAPTGESWTKEITVAVSPPDKFEVYQNYPNPFNPSTTISYQLSAPSGVEGTANSRVSVKIYNMLGQEVASLVDADRTAGYHQEVWDGTRCSSGVYVYQFIATDEQGKKQIARKRMLLLK
jgi:flagellar hook assembly protein FlgD